MHSTIFAVVIDPKDEIIERNEDEVFDAMRNVADYVREVNEIFSNWQWLIQSHYGCVIKGNYKNNKYYIQINFKELYNYFSDKLDKLRDMLDSMSTDEFADHWSPKCYDFECEQNDKFGFYVFDTCEDYIYTETIDEWLKRIYSYMKNKKLSDVEFEIYKVYDYHS